MGEQRVSLENKEYTENMEKMEKTGNIKPKDLKHMIPNTLFMIPNTLFITQFYGCIYGDI